MSRGDYGGDYDYYDRDRYRSSGEEPPRRKAPLPLRVLAWASLVAIFFGVGYGLTSLAFKYLDSGGRRVSGAVTAPEEVSVGSVSDEAPAKDDSYKVFIPSGDSLESKSFKVTGVNTDEDAMKGVLDFFMAELLSSGWMKGSVQVLHIFRSGEWLYLDLSSSFLEGLKALGKDRGVMVMTGLVRTAVENFPPIKRVKVYVDGQEAADRSVVDLSKPWSLKP